MTITITTTCTLCSKEHKRDFDLDAATLHRIAHRKQLGLMIQDIVPWLTADKREFFLTGAHPKCWESLRDKGDQP